MSPGSTSRADELRQPGGVLGAGGVAFELELDEVSGALDMAEHDLDLGQRPLLAGLVHDDEGRKSRAAAIMVTAASALLPRLAEQHRRHTGSLLQAMATSAEAVAPAASRTVTRRPKVKGARQVPRTRKSLAWVMTVLRVPVHVTV